MRDNPLANLVDYLLIQANKLWYNDSIKHSSWNSVSMTHSCTLLPRDEILMFQRERLIIVLLSEQIFMILILYIQIPIAILHGPSMLSDKAKFVVRSIIGLALSFWMKHLVIGQLQKPA